MKTGNIGVITTEDATLMEIDFVTCGLIFCHALHNPKIQMCCYLDEFWLLVDNI